MEIKLKKYKVSAQSLVSLTGEETKKEYIINAEDEESAKKIAFDKMLADEWDGALAEAPLQMFTAEEVGYFYGHEFQPHKITDLVDNIDIYANEMKTNQEAKGAIPKACRDFAWGYFHDFPLDEKAYKLLALYILDNVYKYAGQVLEIDNNRRIYIGYVIGYVMEILKDRGVDVFYILDNELNQQRFYIAVEFFQLLGLTVISPSSIRGECLKYKTTKERDGMIENLLELDQKGYDDKYPELEPLKYPDIEFDIKRSMNELRNVAYIERNSAVNYIVEILDFAKKSDYFCVFRNKTPIDRNVVIISNKKGEGLS